MAFAKETQHKFPDNFLEDTLARLGRDFRITDAGNEKTRVAFAALAEILRTKVDLMRDVADYFGLRTGLQKPFKDYLTATGQAELIHRLDFHRIRRAMH